MAHPRRTALVLGAQGVLGSVVARTFTGEGWDVVRAGRRPEAGPDFRLVDLSRPETLVEALDGVDLVANPVPDERLSAERVVAERGPALVNMSAARAAHGWALKRKAAPARGLVLIHAGIVPGVTSLVAAELLRAHPDANEIELALMISVGGTSGKSGAGLIHRYLTATRHHPTFRAELGPPLGNRTCLEVGPEERGWLADDVVSGRTVRLGIYFRERPLAALLRTLNALRLIGGLPRFAFVVGRGDPPEESTSEPIAEWVAVRRGNERLAACAIEGQGDYRMTAASTIAFAEALLELRAAEPQRTGVFAPEELFTLERLRPALERQGFKFSER
jgi:hypothetical protein